MLAATGKTPTDNEVESLFKKGDLDGNGKPTEKFNGLEEHNFVSEASLEAKCCF